jgi:acyl-coenzyme A thioesterase PaaI-like protein
VSGPALFTLAEFAADVAIIATLGKGWIAGCNIEAVTSNMNINFLARPEPGDVTAGARLMHLGRRQAVAEAELLSQGPRWSPTPLPPMRCARLTTAPGDLLGYWVTAEAIT